MAAMSSAERIMKKKAEKKRRLAEQKKRWHERKKQKTNSEREGAEKCRCETRKKSPKTERKQRDLKKEKQTENRIRKQKQREKEANKRLLKRERQRRWRAKKMVANSGFQEEKYIFPNRMERSRSIQKLKNALPQTPLKRAATLSAYLKSKSPTIEILTEENLIATPEDKLNAKIVNNIKDTLEKSKNRRSDEARAAVNLITASVSGENISNSRTKRSLASTLKVSEKRISRAHLYKKRILHTENAPFIYTDRKTRRDALNDEDKRIIFDFWTASENSHPTGNKKDVKRVRLGPKTYASHAVQILEKTQTEVYQDFLKAFPNIKVSQRSFERCKPFFVRPANKKDRTTCCCRYHLEMKYVFKAVMDNRKRINGIHENSNPLKIYKDIYEISAKTLCKLSDENLYLKKCLDRSCSECGVSNVEIDPFELSTSSESVDLKWKCFEYKDVKTKTGMKKKLMLVEKVTKPGILIQYFLKLLGAFPAHMFRAKWQNSQLKSLVQNLPEKHCITIHDFSENYRCKDKLEIQSDYFQKQEISIHVTLIYRHSVLETDGIESSPDNPHIITEHFIVLSNDEKHDHHFTNYAQESVSKYLKSISCQVDVMHEFCDGCASQYKSRHCLGDLTNSFRNFGYRKIIRNYFETSHAKGPQDAAGGFIKNQADLAIVRGNTTIQSARDLFTFCEENLTVPKSKGCKRRVFNYIDLIPRTVPRQFKPIPCIRSIHQAVAFQTGDISIRSLSCYSCDSCIFNLNTKCENTESIGNFITYKMKRELDNEQTVEDSDEDLSISEIVTKNTIVAVLCDDDFDDFYLFKARNRASVLEKNITDSFGARFIAGSSVIEGNYYSSAEGIPLQFSLIRRKLAVVPSASIVYVFEDDDFRDFNSDRSNVTLFESTNQTIIDCIKMCDLTR